MRRSNSPATYCSPRLVPVELGRLERPTCRIVYKIPRVVGSGRVAPRRAVILGAGTGTEGDGLMFRIVGSICALIAAVGLGASATHSTVVADDVQRTILPSGLVVLTKERSDPDSVAVNVAVRAGSRDEDAATNGAAHF